MRAMYGLALAFLFGCKGGSPTSASSALRFLPAEPELVVRIDMPRVRAWPHYAKVAPTALAGVTNILDGAKARCKLDILGDATSILLAKKGALLAGDLTLVVSGLAKDKVSACLTTIANAKSGLALTLEGDLFHATMAGRPVASGAILASGEVVLVARRGAGVDPAAWKTEVTHGASTTPAWWSELSTYSADPIAVRTWTATRTVVAGAGLGSPFVLRAKVTLPTADEATKAKKQLEAITQYLEQGDAGEGRVEIQGTSVFADLTAQEAQLENLLKIGLPVFGGTTDLADRATRGPRTCADLPAAVETYIKLGLSKAGPDTDGQMAKSIATYLPKLKDAFVEWCTTDAWAESSIDCHIDNADSLTRFEKCRQELTTDQREHLDKALTTALQGVLPDPNAGSAGSTTGSGSAK